MLIPPMCVRPPGYMANLPGRRDAMSTITPASALTWRKTATGQSLHLRNTGPALASLERDGRYPKLWRVRMPDGGLSDMARLEWAKEGALAMVLRVLNSKETASGAVSSGSFVADGQIPVRCSAAPKSARQMGLK